MILSQTGNRRLMRQLNTALVLNSLRQADGISNVQISKTTRLSPATVTSIIKDLKELGFVKHAGPGQGRVGRKPVLLRFNPEARYVISAGVFADETELALLNLAGKIHRRMTFPTNPDRGPQAVFENFAAHARDLLEEASISKNDVWGTGVAIEGITDRAMGHLRFSVRFGWRNVAVKDHIEEQLGIETVVASDGEAKAMGEYHYGAGRGVENLTILDIDAGIGAITISNGAIWRGAHCMAGEVGHTVMNPDGPRCRCGNQGCLEALASGWAIVEAVRHAVDQGKTSNIPSEIHSYSTRQAVRSVFAAANCGDELALEVIRRAGHWLGLATAAVINWTDPQLVILTGCVIDESEPTFLEIIRDVAGKYVVDPEVRTLQVTKGMLGKDAVLIGAASLVYDKQFTPTLNGMV